MCPIFNGSPLILITWFLSVPNKYLRDFGLSVKASKNDLKSENDPKNENALKEADNIKSKFLNIWLVIVGGVNPKMFVIHLRRTT